MNKGKEMPAVYENAEFIDETENKNKESSTYEELEQREDNTEPDKVYTELQK